MMRTASNLVGEPLFNVVIAEGARGQALFETQTKCTGLSTHRNTDSLLPL